MKKLPLITLILLIYFPLFLIFFFTYIAINGNPIPGSISTLPLNLLSIFMPFALIITFIMSIIGMFKGKEYSKFERVIFSLGLIEGLIVIVSLIVVAVGFRNG